MIPKEGTGLSTSTVPNNCLIPDSTTYSSLPSCIGYVLLSFPDDSIARPSSGPFRIDIYSDSTSIKNTFGGRDIMIPKEKIETNYMIPDYLNLDTSSTKLVCEFNWEQMMSNPIFGPFHGWFASDWIIESGYGLIGGRYIYNDS